MGGLFGDDDEERAQDARLGKLENADKAQKRTDDAQDTLLQNAQERLDAQETAIQGYKEVIDQIELSTPEVNGAKGPNRRLRIHVPTPGEVGEYGTTLGMGWPFDQLNYKGFGVDTSGHVVLNARGGKDNSTVSLFANGQVHLQSDQDSLYLLSKAPAILASASGANVLSAGGVMITGGWPHDVQNPVVEGAGPTAPAAVNAFQGWMSSIGNAYAMVDTLVAAAGSMRSIVEIQLAPDRKTAFTGALFGNLVNTYNVANNVLGIVGAPSLGGVTIHGMGGFTLGTPMTGGIYAGLSLTMCSAFPALIGLKDVEVLGLGSAKLTSADAVAVLGMTTEIIGRESMTVAVRNGPLEVLAAGVTIGTLSASPEQLAPTKTVVVCATSGIQLATGEEKPAPTGIELFSAESIVQIAKERILLSAGEQVMMRAGDGSTDAQGESTFGVIAKASPQSIKIRCEDSEIEVKKGEVRVTQGEGALTLNRSKVSLTMGGIGKSVTVLSDGTMKFGNAVKISP